MPCKTEHAADREQESAHEKSPCNGSCA
jgi:hypothetical protein